MSKCLIKICVAVFVLGQMITAEAQVFNAPNPQPNAAVQPAGGPTAEPAGEVQQTAWGIPLPKITMPKVTMPKVSMPSMGAVTAPFKAGFGKVKAGSKKAMEGAKEMFSFAKPDSTTTVNRAAGQQKPSFWQKLIARPAEPQVPQTVGEFMSQPRLDP